MIVIDSDIGVEGVQMFMAIIKPGWGSTPRIRIGFTETRATSWL
jgi:hypothetical protein